MVGDAPGQELRDGAEENPPHEIDMMIELMQRQQDERLAVERGEPIASPPPMGSPRARSCKWVTSVLPRDMNRFFFFADHFFSY